MFKEKVDIKLIFLGDKNVGKSSFLYRSRENKFEINMKNTIGTNFAITSKIIILLKKLILLN
jgi:GTPase SAR1 family protein